MGLFRAGLKVLWYSDMFLSYDYDLGVYHLGAVGIGVVVLLFWCVCGAE